MKTKPQFVICITGGMNTGKSALATIIEDALAAHGVFDVGVAEDMKPEYYHSPSRRRERVRALSEKDPSVLIKFVTCSDAMAKTLHQETSLFGRVIKMRHIEEPEAIVPCRLRVVDAEPTVQKADDDHHHNPHTD